MLMLQENANISTIYQQSKLSSVVINKTHNIIKRTDVFHNRKVNHILMLFSLCFKRNGMRVYMKMHATRLSQEPLDQTQKHKIVLYLNNIYQS